eukprot:COSAG05_NODE_8020_length_745_cov_0.789474_2_plen_79_part_00
MLSGLPPPLHVLSEEEVIQALWTGNKSVARRLVQYVTAGVEAHCQDKRAKARLNKAKANEAAQLAQQMRQQYETAVVS